jgi:hypothetical protein
MKVTNWTRKLRVTLVAAGICVPGAAYAQVIPLGDPGFEAFTVPANPGFAYAAPPNGSYRPTSAWIDDLDSPPGYTQDDSVSNWLYTAAYAEDDTNSRRASPRTGNQAMHGLYNYNAQETGALFEANKTYSFSIWAQHDEILNETNGVFMYVFDGNVPFSDPNALTTQLFTSEINQRQPGMTPAQSQANWSQITIRHHVRAGAPEIGHPVGVGFYGRKDSAVDDASLRVDPIEDFLVFLEVNTSNGQVTIKNQTGEAVDIDYYEITSAGSSLHATNWNSFQEPTGNPSGFPSGDGTGNGWEEFGTVNSKLIGESWPTGSSSVPHSTSSGISLGAAFRVGLPQDLVFQYGQLSTPATLDGDFNNDGVVNAADYPVWRKTDNTQAGYDDWVENFGATLAPSGPSTLIQGFVRYVPGPGSGGGVPEPSTVLLVGMGIASLALNGRRKSGEN